MLLKPRASPGTISSSSQTTTTHALLAQLAEQLTLNQRVVGSSPTGGTSASDRQNTSRPGISSDLRRTARTAEGGSTRLNPTHSDMTRPSRATQGATHLLPDDPGLAAVVEAWPELPDAIKAGIVAMVRAASGSRPDRGAKAIGCEEDEV